MAYLCPAARAAVVLASLHLLVGCMSGGAGLEKVAADASLTTNAVPPRTSAPSDADRASDEITIRNAVSSAYLPEIRNGRIPWANLDTGSRGEISDVAERRDEGVVCRRFRASRESFAGVGLYEGDACLGSEGNWWMRYFRAA